MLRKSIIRSGESRRHEQTSESSLNRAHSVDSVTAQLQSNALLHNSHVHNPFNNMAATNAMLRLQQMTEEAKKQFHQQSAMNSSGRVVQKIRFFLNSALV